MQNFKMGLFSAPKKEHLSKKEREIIDGLSIFLSDIAKLKKERKELVVVFYAPLQEKEFSGQTYHDIGESKETKEALSVVISNLKSVITSGVALPPIKEVSILIGLLRRELLSFEVVFNMFFVSRKLRVENLRQSMREIAKAVVQEEQFLKSLEVKIYSLAAGEV